MSKQLAFILARTGATAARLRPYRILPRRQRAALFKICHLIAGSRLVGDIPFGFEAEVSGTRFQLRGPFRYAAGEYYVAYLTQGAHEAPVTAHITQVVRQHPAPRVLDVGAHYGWYTIYLGKLMANRGMVFAFEPSEEVFTFLKQNIESNGLHNIRLYKLPLSDKRETIRMIESKSSTGETRYMQSVTEKGAMVNDTGIATAISFDELNEKEAIHPNIVKIDVHGVWRKVIDGMKESLRRDVEHLYLELDNPQRTLSLQYPDIQHVISVLRDSGMDVYEIQDFKSRDGGKMIDVDESQIAERKDIAVAMLYGVRRR